MSSVCETRVQSKISYFSESCRSSSPSIVRKRQRDRIQHSKSLDKYEAGKRDDHDFDGLALEKQVCRILRRNHSLPNISTICEHESHLSLWRKSWCKRYSLKRSQSEEWDPISALFTAASEDDMEELERILLEFQIDVNFLGSTGVSLLHTAALVGNTRALQILLNSGAEIEFRDANNRTSLEIALLAGHFDCAALLIENGACMCNIIDGIKVY